MTWNPIHLFGGGPWALAEDCSAARHNTERAARGADGQPHCTCPRALALRKARRDRETVRTRKARQGAYYVAAGPVKLAVPDLSRGACTSGAGRRIARAAQTDATYGWAVRAREEAKEVCRGCPLLYECREYVLAAETPAGSWGSVWGGLESDDRKGLVHGKH